MDAIKMAVLLATGLFWSLAQAQVGNNDSVLNPNLADGGGLAGVAHLDEELVAGIVDGRRPGGWRPARLRGAGYPAMLPPHGGNKTTGTDPAEYRGADRIRHPRREH